MLTFEQVLFALFVIIVIIIIYKISNPITFLSANEAREIFNRNFLIKLMGYKPDVFMNFTENEKEKIEFLYKKSKINYNLKLIKIIDDRGWPFTVEDCIVLPEKLIAQFNQESFNELIVHELIHVKQRKNQKKLNKYYTAIGFIGVPEFRIKTKTPIMFNPDDEPGIKWVMPITDMTVIMPAMVGREQKIIFLRVNDTTGFYEEEQNWPFDSSPYTGLLKKLWKKNLPEADLSPQNNNRYSPNEVLSSLTLSQFDKILSSIK